MLYINIRITNLIIIMHVIIQKPSLSKNLSGNLQGIRKEKKGQRNDVRLHRRPAVELQGEGEPQRYPV